MKRLTLAAMLVLAAVPGAHAGYDEAAALAQRGEAVAAMRALVPLADNGDVRAMKLLASLYRDGGNGLIRDPLRAMQLIRRAAEAGDADAQHTLGMAYAHGAGLSRSPNQAFYWLSIAAENTPADRKAWERERDAAGQELTDGERNQAREAALRFLGRPSRSSDTLAAAPIPLRPAAPESKTTPMTVTPGRSAGSGIVVAADGKILTNAHVVPGCDTVRITFPDGIRRDATIIAKDDLNDLAVLDTPARDLHAARFREGKAVRSGENVVVVGFPLSSVLSSEANVTVGVISALSGRKGDSRFLQITAPVQKGNSGGPLVDMSGNVVGVVATKLDAMKIAERTGDLPQNVNFAVKSDVARQFLSANGVVVQNGTMGREMSAADVGELVKRATVLVECEKDSSGL